MSWEDTFSLDKKKTVKSLMYQWVPFRSYLRKDRFAIENFTKVGIEDLIG
jgi:hypothetical protein